MDTVRFGIVGSGKVSSLHAKAIRAASETARAWNQSIGDPYATHTGEVDCPDCLPIAVYSRNPEHCEAFARRHGLIPRTSIARMIEQDKIDVVLITTPHPSHCSLALEAMHAGAHVLVEKPMALSVSDCTRMLQASRETGKTLGVISQRRWYPALRRMRKALDSGALGRPALGQVIMLGWRDQAYYTSDPWRGSWDQEGGGVLVNQAPHQFDLLAWLMGPVAEISAYWDNINHPYIEVEDSAVAAIRFQSGGMGSILVSNSQKPGIHAKVHIHGTSGASAGVQTDGGAMFIAGMSGVLEAPYNDIWTIPGEEHLRQQWHEKDTRLFASIDATWHFFALQTADFACAVRDQRSPLVTGEDGRETVRIIEGIYRSGKEGSSVRP